MDLERLVYVSVAAEPFSEQALDKLLARARKFNGAHGITGLLLYCEPYFAQAIEGPPAEIEGLIRSINADPRHRSVFIVQRGPVDSRAFDRWEMGFARRSKAEVEALDGFVDFFAPGRRPSQASSKCRTDLERVLGSVVSPA